MVVLDFSASILNHKVTRERFADALDQLAAHVDETTGELVNGEATVSLVRFASKAEGVDGCVDLSLHENFRAAADLADCLRAVATSYRAGLPKKPESGIGIHTDYIEAMQAAAERLPADAKRPAVVFFTDGRHDHPGGPASSTVAPAVEKLFAGRSPFALLPVGMGLDPTDRPTLEAGLAGLRTTRGMDACEDDATFDWPSVVFESAKSAGEAVAQALEEVTCSNFATVPEPEPTPTAPGGPVSVEAAPGDGDIQVSWLPPTDSGSSPVADYQIRCRPTDGGDWIGSSEGVSVETSATVRPLENNVAHTCEVAAVNAAGAGQPTESSASATPFGRPDVPPAPLGVAGDGSAQISVPQWDGESTVDSYSYECSNDTGATWTQPTTVQATGSATLLNGLANGTEYRCRVTAANERGASDASPLSNAFLPCGSLFECNRALLPIIGTLLALILLALLFLVARWWTARTRAFISVQVDEMDTVNLSRGPDVGLGLIRSSNGAITDAVSDRTGAAELRVRYRGGHRFDVTHAGGHVEARAGTPFEFVDENGESHTAVFRATSSPSVASIGPSDDDDNSFWRESGTLGLSTSSATADDGWD